MALQCEVHRAVAGWECTGCNRALCPDCAALKVVTPVTMVVCTHCGAHAEQLMRPKRESASLGQRVVQAYRFPFTGDGIPLWLGFTMWLSLVSLLGGLGALIGWAVTISSFFGLTRSIARGGDHLEVSDFQDPLTSVALPVATLGVVTWPVWVPLIIGEWIQLPGLFWLGLAVGVAWVPTAYVGAAAGASLLHLLNPMRIVRTITNIGSDFLVYLGAMFSVSVTLVLAAGLSAFVSLLQFPLVPRVLGAAMLLYPAIVGAHVAGSVLALHGQTFGWGDALVEHEPVLPGVEPRGTLPESMTAVKTYAPIELEPEPVPVATSRSRFEALETKRAESLDASTLPSHEAQSVAAIRAAMKRNEADTALDGFRATGLLIAGALRFDELLWLAQLAANRIDYESAELAYRHAVEREAPPETLARARVMFARLLAEKLERPDDARGWWWNTRALPLRRSPQSG